MFRMAKWYSRDRKLDKRRTTKTFSKPFKKDQTKAQSLFFQRNVLLVDQKRLKNLI